MQQAQSREMPERMSWARAMIFAVGFFFISAILIGQLPGYIFLQMNAATLEGMERGALGLAIVMLGGFVIVQVMMLLFDPKPVVSPRIFTILGVILGVAGLALIIWSTTTGCTPTNHDCNQFFPREDTVWNPMLGGKILWFETGAVDFVTIGLALLGIGAAMVFYSVLAIREMSDPDRRDLGTTPGIRRMIITGATLVVLFLIAYTYLSTTGLANALFPNNPFIGEKLVDLILAIILGAAILVTAGAFALRLHYLMRPVRKRTMAPLYMVGALGLAQFGAILLIVWFILYPAVAWIHSWTFIGLGEYLTTCASKLAIPASCSFSAQSGYLADTIVTSTFFAILMGAIWAWKSNRNLVVIGSVVTVATIAAATLMIHTDPEKLLLAMALCAAMLVLAAIWTSVARREFAVVGENNLGCLGQWLVVGTCLFIYLAAFAIFSFPAWEPETEPNITLTPGLLIPPPTTAGGTPVITSGDALMVLVVMGILAGIQYFFLVRNRYKV